MSETQETAVSRTEQPVSMEMLRYKEELAEKMGLPSPFGMQLMKQVAQDLLDSGMVPKHFAGNPMAVFMAAMRGREMGLQPMESVLETFWAAPGGRLGMYANKMLDLMHRNGIKTKFLREDAEGCEIVFTPANGHEPYTGKFLIEEAVQAGLVKPDSNWKKWPADMCKARAISRAWRALAGAFNGAATLYSKEELEDIASDEITAEQDQRRADVLAAEGDFRVELKKKPAETEKQAVIDVRPEPESNVGQVDNKATPVYEIHLVMQTAGGGIRPVATNEPTQTDKGAAELRAQALANETGQRHDVVIFTPATSERLTVYQAHPPAAKAAAPKDAPAADASKPAAASPAPAAPASGVSTSTERLKALAAKLGIAEKTALTRFNQYFAGFLDTPVAQLKAAPRDQLLAALDELESQIARDADEFRAGPEEAGKRSRLDNADFMTYLVKLYPMDPDVAVGCQKLRRAWNLTGANFRKFWEYNKLDKLEIVDVTAYLRVAVRTRDVAKLAAVARDHNLSIAKLVEQMEVRLLDGKKIEAVEVEKLVHAIEVARQAAAEQAKKPAETSAPGPTLVQPAAPAAAEEEQPDETGENMFAGLD